VPGDGNGLNDVFVRERCVSPNVTVRVSVDENGSPLLRESTDPDISSDGRFVAFDNNGVIRRYDRDLGASVLVAEGNFAARVPAISADGGRIAFWSFASNLVVDDTNGMWDIFLWEADGASVTLVSTTESGEQQVQGNEGVSTIAAPGISGDGRFVAFRSRTTNLLPGETGGFSHVYVKDTATGAIERASRSSSGELGNGDSSGSGSGLRPSLSFDGKWIAFTTRASNLAPETGGMVPNIVAHNRLTGTTVGFTTATSDDPPSISGDLYGRFVAMFSTGKLDPQFPSSGVFLHDRHTPPVANAGRPQTVTAGSVVMLNGRRSFLYPNPYLAPTEPSLQYLWSQLEGPTAVSFVPGPTVATPSFTATDAGIYRFQLVVSDTVAPSAPSTVAISVR
jgi:hypothetical protein